MDSSWEGTTKCDIIKITKSQWYPSRRTEILPTSSAESSGLVPIKSNERQFFINWTACSCARASREAILSHVNIKKGSSTDACIWKRGNLTNHLESRVAYLEVVGTNPVWAERSETIVNRGNLQLHLKKERARNDREYQVLKIYKQNKQYITNFAMTSSILGHVGWSIHFEYQKR